MGTIKSFFLNIALFLILDVIWMKFIAGAYFAEILAPIARMDDGAFDVNIKAAVVVYVLMSFALEFFVLKNRMSTFSKVSQAALLGFVIYGVFDFTNYAILKDYPKGMLLVDVGWGTVLFAVVAYIRCLMTPKKLFT